MFKSRLLVIVTIGIFCQIAAFYYLWDYGYTRGIRSGAYMYHLNCLDGAIVTDEQTYTQVVCMPASALQGGI